MVSGSCGQRSVVAYIALFQEPIKWLAFERADHSFLCSSKMQEWNSFVASFPMCRKDSRTAMSCQPSIQRTRRPKFSSFRARMKSNCMRLVQTLMLTRLMSEASGSMIRCSRGWLSLINIQTKKYAALLN